MVSTWRWGQGAAGPARTLSFARQFFKANAAVFEYSDMGTPLAIEDGHDKRFVRAIDDGIGQKYCCPAGRVRFQTDATSIDIYVRYNGLDTLLIGGLTGRILVNGSSHDTFTSTAAEGRAVTVKKTITFGSQVSRTIEVLLPYGDGIDFQGVEIDNGFAMAAPTARSGLLWAALGDSITHGYFSTDVWTSWPTLTAISKGWRLINLGYGGRGTVAADGTLAGALGADRLTVLLGYNDFDGQVALSTFKSNYKSLISNYRTANPSGRIYAITPLWTATVKAIPIEDYRQQIRDGMSELALSNAFVLEGPSMATNNVSSFPDNVHPNDTGSGEIATYAAANMS